MYIMPIILIWSLYLMIILKQVALKLNQVNYHYLLTREDMKRKYFNQFLYNGSLRIFNVSVFKPINF